MVKRWLKKHKNLLITFGITSVIFTIITSYQIFLLLDNVNDLKHYTETGIITDAMFKYGIVAALNMIIGFCWMGLFFIVIWKIIFPDYKTVKNAFFLGELEFLAKMPSAVRKELHKKNE